MIIKRGILVILILCFALATFSEIVESYVGGGLVQTGTVTGTGRILLDTIPVAVNRNQSFLLFTANTNDATPDDWQFTGNISSTTQVNFTRYEGVGISSTIVWWIVSSRDLRVQKGARILASSTADVNVTISPVDRTEAFVIVNGRCADELNTDSHAGFFKGIIHGNNQLWLKRGNAAKCEATVDWQVVEWDGASVQMGNATKATSTENIKLLLGNAVNTTRSILFYSWASIGTNSGQDANLIQGNLTNSTGLTFRNNPGTAGANSERHITWYVVEIPGLVVRRSDIALSGDASDYFSRINYTSSFPLTGHAGSGTNANYQNSFFTANMTNATRLLFDKMTGTSTLSIAWQIIQLRRPDLSPPEFYVNATNITTIIGGIPVRFNINWTDDGGLSKNYFETNITGTVRNYSLTLSGKSTKINITNISGLQIGRFYWKSYTNDTNTNRNKTGKMFLRIRDRPNVTSITVDDLSTIPSNEIDLVENSTKLVNCSGNIRDRDGFSDVKNASAIFYANNKGYATPRDNNTKYTNNSCVLNSGSGNDIKFYCTFKVQYYANDTTWTCNATSFDNFNLRGYRGDGVSINSLLALSLPEYISFVSFGINRVTDENVTNVTNTGNTRIDLRLDGYAQTPGDNRSFNCSVGGFISIGHERYNITKSNGGTVLISNFSARYKNLTSFPTIENNFNLLERQNDNVNDAFKAVYWRVYVPLIVPQVGCSGYIRFSAVAG